ncbi:acyclic terpene utilization AtuA family protein [Nocardia takedensis]|uniref:acyclic terpene utilization AtuA family protein n=1 Tax=Nocardia takedensis TaxID=259390 RepID=UPI000318ABB5|nr:acyclic terpene utilization AtuA family protein [Nocardia takedensis]
MARQPVRVANFSGYYGDRFSAFDEAMGGDPFDVLVGDYLAEITLASLSAAHHRDPSRGYVEYFVDQLRPHLGAIAERGIKVVTNAGGFRPAILAEVLRAEIAAAGVALRVAHIEGDNILADLASLRAAGHRFDHLDTGAALADWAATPFAANAYLGGWGIAAALRAGADIVVCGRVTDASLTVGPAAWWHDWSPEDWDALAGAVVAGHIIECGPHAVGGNFSGFLDIPDRVVPGFPLAEIAADGNCVVTKHARDGGTVTPDTVTAQVVYEIQGPLYLNPDVSVRLDDVRVTAAGPDRVLVSGARGGPPPPTTKVALFAPVGYTIVNTVYVTAPHVAEKVDLLRAQLEHDLPEDVTVHLTTIGAPDPDPASQWAATVAVRVMLTAPTAGALDRADLARRLGGLYLQSIPGYFHDVAAGLNTTPRPRVEFWPGLLPQAALAHRVRLDDGSELTVDPPARTETARQPEHPEPDPAPAAERVREVPLGTVAHARSGDKGGNSNLGIWTADARVWPWLRAYLSTDRIRTLIPEAADLDIVRHEFPDLRAVHFVLRGLLGAGGSANTRIDQVGKAIGEYVRARRVPVPEDLLTATTQESTR